MIHAFLAIDVTLLHVLFSFFIIRAVSICYEKEWDWPNKNRNFTVQNKKKLFIFQIVRFNGICIWQIFFCILPNFGDLGAKTSLFRYLINQKRNNFIKHCPPPPPCINKPPISEMYIYKI